MKLQFARLRSYFCGVPDPVWGPFLPDPAPSSAHRAYQREMPEGFHFVITRQTRKWFWLSRLITGRVSFQCCRHSQLLKMQPAIRVCFSLHTACPLTLHNACPGTVPAKPGTVDQTLPEISPAGCVPCSVALRDRRAARGAGARQEPQSPL